MGNFNRPILITGCPSSGQSFLAGILYEFGIVGGTLNENFENEEVKNLSTTFLQERNIDKDFITGFPVSTKLMLDKKFKRKVSSTLVKQGHDLSKKWFHFDSRLCIIWPLWKMGFPKSTWIVVNRRDKNLYEEIKTKFSFTKEEEINSFINNYKNQIIETKKNCPQVQEFNFDEFLEGDIKRFKEIIYIAGITWTENLEELVQNYIRR